MDDNIRDWVTTFEQEWEEKPIEYKAEDGGWEKDGNPLFGSISTAIASRGYEISVDELLRISRWKLQSERNHHNIKKNDAGEVSRRTREALENSTDKEAIDTLTDLSGVGVPMASTVLTVAKPDEYAIIDYRAFRGLVAAKPRIITPDRYDTYATFLEYFRTYLTNPEAYVYYMDHVRDIADTENLSAREVDMALWAFDKEHA